MLGTMNPPAMTQKRIKSDEPKPPADSRTVRIGIAAWKESLDASVHLGMSHGEYLAMLVMQHAPKVNDDYARRRLKDRS